MSTSSINIDHALSWFKKDRNLKENPAVDATQAIDEQESQLKFSQNPTSMTNRPIEEHQANNLAGFSDTLALHRFWHIQPTDVSDINKSVGMYDTSTQALWPTPVDLHECLKLHPFLQVYHQRDQQLVGTLHSATQILWSNAAATLSMTTTDAQQSLEKERLGGPEIWQLPTKAILERFAKASENPNRGIQSSRLRTANGGTTCNWLTETGRCDIDDGQWTIDPSGTGYIFACNLYWQHASLAQILIDLAARGWELHAPSGSAVFKPPAADARWKGLSAGSLLAAWSIEGLHLKSLEPDSSQQITTLKPSDYELSNQFAQLDFTPCRLPELDNAQLTDPEKGLWELWGKDAASLKDLGLVARDPGLDIQRRAVAIDFGTSSTVVAMDTPSGARELLRIGIRDFFQPLTAQDFENPTVLECVDYAAFSSAWTATAYRPSLNWDWMRAAHEAREHYRENPGDTRILSSVMPLLKQWALRTNDQRKRLTDQQTPGHEMELAPHTELNPVRGQELDVSGDYEFDPIELYAWYLGMAINWRGRGLFLKYYLSFPVKYPSQVKENILASFRRGLQRSLPQTLITHHPRVLNEFEVNDLATEPAAYVAAAMPHLGVEPTEAGVPYAVFDFGGGTSDFDYGVLRWSNDEEEDQGYDRVFEHLGSSGDNFLGGENLLEHLVYESFKHNLPALREKRVQFTQPIDAQPFAGSEAFLSRAQAAQTNAIMMADKLRGFLESDKAELTSPIKLDLIDVNGGKQTCELALDAKALDNVLATRMRRGVEAFFAELARLQPQFPEAAPIQVLLAGNGSRSRHIKVLFDTEGPAWEEMLAQAFGKGNENWNGSVPTIVVHRPLPMDNTHPHAPTAKTGVALGLLRLVPGENTLLKNSLKTANEGEAPFAWFAGRMRRGAFEPSIAPNATYGKWMELGALQQGVFHLYITNSPRAHSLKEGDGELHKHPLDFPAALANSRVFARAVKPHLLELAAAPDSGALDSVVPMAFILD